MSAFAHLQGVQISELQEGETAASCLPPDKLTSGRNTSWENNYCSNINIKTCDILNLNYCSNISIQACDILYLNYCRNIIIKACDILNLLSTG